MTEERLQEIRERVNKATPGKWVYGAIPNIVYVEVSEPVRRCIYSETHSAYEFSVGKQNYENATFIAHAREDVPNLLAEVERWKRRFALLEFEIGEIREYYDRLPDDEREVHVVDEILSKLSEIKDMEIEVNAN